MRKIIDYVVFEDDNAHNLTRLVNGRLRDGYELYGPVVTAGSSSNTVMVREMVKYDSPEEEQLDPFQG